MAKLRERREGEPARVIAAKALGRPLGLREVAHHADCNHKNNRNDNLVICPDASYHALLHARIRFRKKYGTLEGAPPHLIDDPNGWDAPYKEGKHCK